MAPAFKPAYLIHGDDHGAVVQRRAKLRALAERQSGPQGVELLEGQAATPDGVAAALDTMTFAVGRRFLIVDGVERWKDRELERLLTALETIPPDTTVAFFAREEGSLKAPAPLHDAIRKAGGDLSAEQTVKPWELARWVAQQARALGLELTPEAARVLVGQVGERQQRLLRELERLALELGEPDGAPDSPRRPIPVDAEQVQELTASSAEHHAWSLADTLLAGDPARATRAYLQARAQGERLPGLIYWISSRLRQAHNVASALEAGEPESAVRGRLRMRQRAAEQLVADARRIGAARLREAIELTADLELASRGGARRGADEDTAALLAIRSITA
ncbi:MAG: DNA polymerase III subunit delta [Solirubrobacteraceae bacterium]